MIRSRVLSAALALPMLSAIVVAPAVHAQPAQSASVPQGDKAGRPPVEAAASQSGVATKKPAKSGTQSGPTSAQADAASAEKGNKATKPAVSQEAARSGVATKKPAKAGAQAGPASAAASAAAR